jgi:hypothetical protein
MRIQEVAENFLSRVSLRLIKEEERERFDQLLETQHYLQSARIGGRYLRYVAEVDGDWVTILTFSGAAPHLKQREKWVGWSPRQRARRLGFVIKNSHFSPSSSGNAIPIWHRKSWVWRCDGSPRIGRSVGSSAHWWWKVSWTKAASAAPATAPADLSKLERALDFPVTRAITTPNTDNPKRSTYGNSNQERAKHYAVPASLPPSKSTKPTLPVPAR